MWHKATLTEHGPPDWAQAQKRKIQKTEEGLESTEVERWHISQAHKNGVRKAKVQLELKLLSNVNRKKGGSCKSFGSKRNIKKNVHQLCTGTGGLVTRDMEKTKVLNVFSASVSTEECNWKAALHHLQKVMAILAPDGWTRENTHPSLGRARRWIQGTTVQSVYHQSPGRLWASSSWKTCPYMK